VRVYSRRAFIDAIPRYVLEAIEAHVDLSETLALELLTSV
jgi:hypothetical protein